MALGGLQRLEVVLGRVDADVVRGVPAGETIAHLVEFCGGRYDRTGSTNLLRCAGVVGTCTSSPEKGVLESWLRAAHRRLAKAGAA